jgi:ATP-dependent RNA helicase DDX5/DBP2
MPTKLASDDDVPVKSKELKKGDKKVTKEKPKRDREEEKAEKQGKKEKQVKKDKAEEKEKKPKKVKADEADDEEAEEKPKKEKKAEKVKEEKKVKEKDEKKAKEATKENKNEKHDKKDKEENGAERATNGVENGKRKHTEADSNPAKKVKLNNERASAVPAAVAVAAAATAATPNATAAPAAPATPAEPVVVLPVNEWRSKHKVDAPHSAPDPAQRFDDVTVQETIRKWLLAAKYTAPTPIQAQSWPIALSGSDMIGIAETGSGKTLAYLVPGVSKLLELHEKNIIPPGSPSILILAPTRELAQQIQQVAAQLARPLGLKSGCFYGGAPRNFQLRSIREGVDIAIATPGRLNDFLECNQLSLKHVFYAVLDEADRMLDMGFEPQIASILRITPPHQTLMFSATWPREVRDLAVKFQNSPVKITIGNPEHTANKNIAQIVKVLKPGDTRLEALKELVKEIFKDNCKMLCFTNTKAACAEYAQALWDDGQPANAIHGDMEQYAREMALRDFKSGKYPILFATDVAARGLDIKGVEYVINVDMPVTFDSYVHRIGRTGRAGQKGVAYAFVTAKDADLHMLADSMKQSGSEPPPELIELARKTKMSGAGRKFDRMQRQTNRFGGFGGDGSMDESGGWGGGRGGRGGRGFR